MPRIGDLYSGAGLYGCALNSSAGQTLYNSSDPATTTSNEFFFCAGVATVFSGVPGVTSVASSQN